MKLQQLVPALLVSSLSLSSVATAVVFSVGDFRVIDNIADDNYSPFTPLDGAAHGTDTGVGAQGTWGGVRDWGNGGSATVSTWSWGTGTNGDPSLDPGVYEVFSSWRFEPQANLENAIYSGTDAFVATTLNQEPGVSSFANTVTLNDGTNDVGFVSLGTVSITDGTFSLTLTDDAADAEFVFSDAAAIRAVVPEPSSSLLGLLGLSFLAMRRQRK